VIVASAARLARADASSAVRCMAAGRAAAAGPAAPAVGQMVR